MPSLRFSAFIVGISIWVSLISPAQCLTCSSQKFTGNDVYAHCLDLPSLSAFLHFSYNSSNSTLSVAFLASPAASGGWVSWALNPTGTGMAGAQALVAYKNSKSVMTVNFYNISSYSSVVKSEKLAFDVWDQQAEEKSGVMRIFAKLKVPSNLAAKGTVNHIWQVGSSVDETGDLTAHAMSTSNLNAKGTLDLKGGQTVVTNEVDSRAQKKNVHGILNVVSWGILIPIGIIMARYLRPFKSADPAWFYLHVSCQVSAYGIGVAGWATGMKLGSESEGIVYSIHRNIGITVFVFATLQVFALFLRPQKDHKYRFFWNIYHHSIGYGALILGTMNIFRGLDILSPEQKWRSAYISVIAILGGIALLLEVITWIAVSRSKKSTKPYEGYNAP